MTKTRTLLPLTILLLLGFIWGTGYTIARYAVTHGVTPLGYSFWQSLGPAIFLTLVALLRKKNVVKRSIRSFPYLIICGLTGIALPNSNMYVAASHLPAGLLAVIVNTVPIFSYVLALLVGLEIFRWQRLLAVWLALMGVLLLVIPKASLPSPEMLSWVLISLISPLSFAFCAVFITRFRPKQLDTVEIAAGTLVFSSVLLLPIIIASKQFYFFHFPLTGPDLIVLLEIFLSSIGYLLFFKLLQISGPVYYSFVDTIVAVTGLAWGFVIFNEHLNIFTASAVILILFGLILINRQTT